MSPASFLAAPPRFCRGRDSNPHGDFPGDFKSPASASSATPALRGKLERETGLEPATSASARRRSTTELFPHAIFIIGVPPSTFKTADSPQSSMISATRRFKSTNAQVALPESHPPHSPGFTTKGGPWRTSTWWVWP